MANQEISKRSQTHIQLDQFPLNCDEEQIDFQEMEIDSSISFESELENCQPFEFIENGLLFPVEKSVKQEILLPFLSELEENTRNEMLTEKFDLLFPQQLIERFLNNNTFELAFKKANKSFSKLRNKERKLYTGILKQKFNDIIMGFITDDLQIDADPQTTIFSINQINKNTENLFEKEESREKQKLTKKGIMKGKTIDPNYQKDASKSNRFQDTTSSSRFSFFVGQSQPSGLSVNQEITFDQTLFQISKNERSDSPTRLSRVSLNLPSSLAQIRNKNKQKTQQSLMSELIEQSRYQEVIIQALIDDKKLNINYQDDEGNTYLMLAAQIGDKYIINLLLSSGADKRITNNNSDTALSKALAYQNYDVADILLLHEPDDI